MIFYILHNHEAVCEKLLYFFFVFKFFKLCHVGSNATAILFHTSITDLKEKMVQNAKKAVTVPFQKVLICSI